MNWRQIVFSVSIVGLSQRQGGRGAEDQIEKRLYSQKLRNHKHLEHGTCFLAHDTRREQDTETTDQNGNASTLGTKDRIHAGQQKVNTPVVIEQETEGSWSQR